MEKLNKILELMFKYKKEIELYIQWDKENPGVISSSLKQNLIHNNTEIDKISERIKIIIQNINLKRIPDADDVLKKIDEEIQKKIDLLDKEKFRLLDANENDQLNFKTFMDLLAKWEAEFNKLDASSKKNWNKRMTKLLNFRNELIPFVAACNKNTDKKSRKKISNIIKKISLNADQNSRLKELSNKTALNSSEENEKIELETASNYTKDLYKLLSKTVVIAEFAVNNSTEEYFKIDGKTIYNSEKNGFVLKYSNEAILAHEMQHLIQAMKGQLLYGINGYPVEYLYDLNDEVEAYKVQFLFDPNSVPGLSDKSKISDITPEFVKEIQNEHKEKSYINLPTENYNTLLTLEELSKHPASGSLKNGISNEEWEISKNVKFIDFLKDDKIKKGVKNYLTFGIKIFLFIACFIILSCNPYKKATGMYYNEKNALGLQLYQDSTFAIAVVYSHMASSVKNVGLYKIEKDRIILHSHNKYQNAALNLEINALKTDSDSVSIIYGVYCDETVYRCFPLYLSINDQNYVEKFNSRFCIKDTVHLIKNELKSLKIKTIGKIDSNIYCPDINNYNEFSIRAECFNNKGRTIYFDSLVFEKKGANLLNITDTISIVGTSIEGKNKFIIPGKLTKKLKNPDGSIQSIDRIITALKTDRFRCN